jgi:hypothetical protein
MDENYQNEIEHGERESHPMFWLGALAILLLIGAAATSMYYSYQQKNTISQLTSQTSSMNSTIGQLQSELSSTTQKLNDVSAAQTLAAQTAAAQAAAKPARAGAAGPSRAELNRLKQIQSRLDEQQQQLQSTQDSVTQARTDLQGNLDSTRDQLNGSIAKTHDELVLLEKRGEHRYFEFDLTKGKQFVREGPVSLMIRRSDAKHANLDLGVLVNDKQITKKKVNLYEPVWIYESANGDPLQVVVNRIDDKGVHGYVSAPRYTASDLSASAASAPEAPASTPAPAATPQPDNGSTGSVTGRN